jgi:hypothetical protein
MESPGYLGNINTRVEEAEDTTFDRSKLGLHADSSSKRLPLHERFPRRDEATRAFEPAHRGSTSVPSHWVFASSGCGLCRVHVGTVRCNIAR